MVSAKACKPVADQEHAQGCHRHAVGERRDEVREHADQLGLPVLIRGERPDIFSEADPVGKGTPEIRVDLPAPFKRILRCSFKPNLADLNEQLVVAHSLRPRDVFHSAILTGPAHRGNSEEHQYESG